MQIFQRIKIQFICLEQWCDINSGLKRCSHTSTAPTTASNKGADDGMLIPRQLTVGIAVEPAIRANGCLHLVPGSHRMGLMNYRDSESFDNRVASAKKKLGLVHCEIDAGDAVFFRCNTLHGYAAIETDKSRLMFFASYNAKLNEAVRGV